MLRDEISDQTRDTALLVGAGLIAGLTGAALLFSGLIASMRRPLEDLVQASERLAGGDLETRVQVGGLSETAQLGAAFNKNLLVRINTELGGEFDLSSFVHRAVWNRDERRVEMHLVSRADQAVRIASAGTVIAFKRGEHIWTESSYKYSPDDVRDMASDAGFATRDQWVDADAGFALTLLEA